MMELFQESIRPINFPVSCLLVVMTLYWLMVIVGGLDIELLDLSHDVDVSHDVEVDANGHAPFGMIGQLLHLGEAPVTIVISILITIMWGFSVIGNFYLNKGDSYLLGAGLFAGNMVVSTILTSIVVLPIAAGFRKLQGTEAKKDVVGDTCRVISTKVDPESGQAEVTIKDGAPIAINARTNSEVLQKGQQAVVVRKNDNGTYLIKSLEE